MIVGRETRGLLLLNFVRLRKCSEATTTFHTQDLSFHNTSTSTLSAFLPFRLATIPRLLLFCTAAGSVETCALLHLASRCNCHSVHPNSRPLSTIGASDSGSFPYTLGRRPSIRHHSHTFRHRTFHHPTFHHPIYPVYFHSAFAR